MKFAEVKVKFSCKNCVAPKRHPGCHDTCKEYQSEKAKLEAKKEVAKKNWDYESLATSVVVRRSARCRHAKLGESQCKFAYGRR